MTAPLAASIFLCAIAAPLALGWWFARRRRPRWAVRAAFALYPFFCVAAILAAGAEWLSLAAWGLVLGFLELSIVLQWAAAGPRMKRAGPEDSGPARSID
jgi:hypothetical protein